MRLAFIYLIIILCSSGCATFSSRIVKESKVKITENELSKLNGTYDLFPDIGYDKKGESFSIKTKASLANFQRYISEKKIEFDSLKNYTLELDLVSNNKLKFIIRNDRTIIDSIIITGKLKKNGMFQLDNKFVKRHGVPFLFGSIESNKTRIGITRDNGLLLNRAVDSSGAFMFFIWAGYSYNFAYHFKRIN